LGRIYTTEPTPPVAATGLRGDPPRPRPVPVELDEEDFVPTGEPPPDPADEEAAPPDVLAEADRWPAIARIASRHEFTATRVLALAGARADASEQALIQELHAELEATTDYELIAAINAEYLAADLAA
jgi:hypothetical protein